MCIIVSWWMVDVCCDCRMGPSASTGYPVGPAVSGFISLSRIFLFLWLFAMLRTMYAVNYLWYLLAVVWFQTCQTDNSDLYWLCYCCWCWCWRWLQRAAPGGSVTTQQVSIPADVSRLFVVLWVNLYSSNTWQYTQPYTHNCKTHIIDTQLIYNCACIYHVCCRHSSHLLIHWHSSWLSLFCVCLYFYVVYVWMWLCTILRF